MQIGYVSTFLPQRCGIATYLDYLTNPLRKLGVDIKIIAEKEAAARAENGFEVIPCWGRKENYVEQILHHAQTVDVLHIQHEYSIYGFDDRLPTLLRTLEGKVKRVVTIHCIRPAQFSERGAVDEQYAKRIAELADAVIVHLETQRDILRRLGIPAEKINVIPHGSELIKVDQIESRKKLGLPLDAKLMLMFGFIKPHKCLHVVIEAMPTILEKVPNAILFVAGGLAPTAPPEHQAYVQRIEKQISELGIQAHVILPNKFFPNEDVPHLFGAVDVVLFPYYEEDRSASGSFHLALGAGKPIVASRIPKFEELKNVCDELLILPHNSSGLANVVVRLFTDTAFRNFVETRTKTYAEKTSWENTAKKHLDLYTKIAG